MRQIAIHTGTATGSGRANFAAKAVLVCTALGLVALVGWLLGAEALQSILPGHPRMPASEALLLLFLSLGLWLILPQPADSTFPFRYRAGQAIAIVAAGFSALALSEYLLGWNPAANLKPLGGPPGAIVHALPGQLAFPTVLSTLCLGLGIALAEVRIRAVWLNEAFAVATLQMAVLALIGHLFSVPQLYGTVPSMSGTGMAMHSATGLLVLAIGVLAARPERGLMAVVRSRTPGGTLARGWMVVPVFMLVMMGLVYLALNRTAGVNRAIGTWVLFMTNLGVLTIAVWSSAVLLHRVGLERDEAQLHLERRVGERTAELNEANQALNEAKENLARANENLEKTVQERTLHLKETITSLETVCYNIAHDLRAPNRAIAGFAQALLGRYSGPLDATARDCLRRIAAAAQRSDALTLDLLAYGRLGHEELPCGKLCLKDHLQNVLEKLAEDISLAQASVEITEPLPEVWANPTALEQALANLLGNAMKFVADGVRPRVEVRVEAVGEFCRIFVQDNGIGIPVEHQQNIFRVFHRLHSAEKYPGSGIGLAIVQKSVERMGGKVGVSSEPEKGSCFWIELRRA